MSLRRQLTQEYRPDSRERNYTLTVHHTQCIQCVPEGAPAALEGGGGRRGGAFLVLGAAVGASLALVTGVDAAGEKGGAECAYNT